VRDQNRLGRLLSAATRDESATPAAIETTEPANATQSMICFGKIEETVVCDSGQAGAGRAE
jgi:hypothetical protein